MTTKLPALICLLAALGECRTPASQDVESTGNAAAPQSSLCLWYRQPAANCNEALPLGNRRLGAMVFGGVAKERLQLNEDSLWAGCPTDAYPENFSNHLAEVRRLIFAGKNAEAHAYGVEHLTVTPTSFRSYQPLGDLWLEFGGAETNANYRREWQLADGLARVSYHRGNVTITREAFISAPDDALVVRVVTDQPGRLDFKASLTRERDASVTAAAGGRLDLDGQIMDVEGKDGGRPGKPGGSGPADQQFVLELLPALPKAWSSGSVKGLPARGGFEVHIAWQNGKVADYHIRSNEPREVKVRVNGEVKTIRTEILR